MTTTFIPLAAGMQKCLICEAPLFFRQARSNLLCGRAECGRLYSLLQQRNRVCTVCGRPLSWRELPSRICMALECQRIAVAGYARQQRERDEARDAAMKNQAAQIRDQATQHFGIQNPDSFRLVVIPALDTEITQLPAQRRRDFRRYLSHLISQAVVAPDALAVQQDHEASPSPDRNSRVAAVLGQACACCKGVCCQGGGTTHAYLSVETMRRYMTAHPGQCTREVLAAYLDPVGDKTYQGSCVYHQASGCSLPREMRSDVCNRFFCKGLHEFQRSLPCTGPVRGFVVAAIRDAIQTAAFVHENQMLIVRGVPAPTIASESAVLSRSSLGMS